MLEFLRIGDEVFVMWGGGVWNLRVVMGVSNWKGWG